MGIRKWLHDRKVKNADIQELFLKRAKQFTLSTAEIITCMPNAMEAIIEYMKLEKAFTVGARLDWREVSLYATNVQEPLIVMVGAMIYPPDTEAELSNGEKITVTKETAENFQRIVRVGFPLRLAKAPKEAIMAYLSHMDEENRKELNEVKQVLRSIIPEQPEAQPALPAVKNDTITTIDEFDLTKLTDEQKARLYATTKPKQ